VSGTPGSSSDPGSGSRAPAGPVSIRTRFERFPATLKGAFVIRGEDADPHQIVFLEGRVVRMPTGPGTAIPVGPVTLEIAPRQDIFVPFELALGDLEPGWYALESRVDLDGSPRTIPGDRRFAIPWPRGAVRRGPLVTDARLEPAGGPSVELIRVDGESTACSVQYAVEPGADPVDVRLIADGARLHAVEEVFDPETGRGKVTTYPALASHRRLRVEVAVGRGRGSAARSASLEVDLS
jgi:hypothetical protein